MVICFEDFKKQCKRSWRLRWILITPGRETEISALGALRTLTEEKYLQNNGYHFVTLETLGVKSL